MNRYRICYKCSFSHYENCKTCYGFGVYKSSIDNHSLLPVAAWMAYEKPDTIEWFYCPECKSGINGLPDNVYDEMGEQDGNA